MKFLIDAHALIWATDDPSKLGVRASQVLQDRASELFLSAGTVWEIAIKTGLGRLELSLPLRDWVGQVIVEFDLTLLPITVDHAHQQAGLPHHHKDPFDRLLVAQAQVEGCSLVSCDTAFDTYSVPRLW